MAEGSLDRQVFEEGLAALVALEVKGAARVLLGAMYAQVELIEDHPDVAAELEVRSLTFADLNGVADEVAEMVTTMVRGRSVETLLRNRHSPAAETPPGLPDEEIRERFKIVEQRFDVATLRRRWWAKSTSKDLVAEEFVWEVSRKQRSESGLPPGGEPVILATLTVRGQRADDPFGIFRGGNDLTLTLDEADVDYILESLNRLKQALDER